MKAISLWQPWATLMAQRLKRIETRSWYTAYRGPLLIHAAKRKPTKQEVTFLQDECFDHDAYFYPYDLVFGALLCRVDLVDCVPTGTAKTPMPDELEYHLGNYNPGRYMWITDNLQVFYRPIPYRGRQRLFDVPEEVIR